MTPQPPSLDMPLFAVPFSDDGGVAATATAAAAAAAEEERGEEVGTLEEGEPRVRLLPAAAPPEEEAMPKRCRIDDPARDRIPASIVGFIRADCARNGGRGVACLPKESTQVLAGESTGGGQQDQSWRISCTWVGNKFTPARCGWGLRGGSREGEVSV